MLKFKTFIFVIYNLLAFSQVEPSNTHLKISYTHSTHFKSLPKATTINAYLLTNNKYTLYTMDYLGIEANEIDENDTEEGKILRVKPTRNPKIYKEKEQSTIYSVERISLNPFLVKDHFNIFKWNLGNTFKTILNYKCQKATMHYRGRDYVAYFTTELPYKVGPWKFEGLPGVILEIKSVDGVFKIEANKIEVKNHGIDLRKDNLSKKSITWDAYVAEYNRKYKEFQGYSNPEGGTQSIPKTLIEQLVVD